MQKRNSFFLFFLGISLVLSACQSDRKIGNDNVLIGDQSSLVIPMSYDLRPPSDLRRRNSLGSQNMSLMAKDTLHKQIFGTQPETPEHITFGERSFLQNIEYADSSARNNLNTPPTESKERFLDKMLHKQKSESLNPYDEMQRLNVPRTVAAEESPPPPANSSAIYMSTNSEKSMQANKNSVAFSKEKTDNNNSTIQFMEGDF